MTKVYNLSVLQDECPSNPREEYDCFGSLIYCTDGSVVCDKQVQDMAPWRLPYAAMSGRTIKEEILGHTERAFAVPVFSSAGMLHTDDGEYYDDGAVGFIFVSADDVFREFGGNMLNITQDLIDKVEHLLRSEIEVYRMYQEGEVYGYVIRDENGDEVDSCWGFYGYEYCQEEGEMQLKNLKEEGESDG